MQIRIASPDDAAASLGSIAPAPARELDASVVLALLALYFIWGSTYLGIRVALQAFPPLLLAGLRFVIAGGILLGWLRLRGATLPSPAQWRAGAIVGVLLTGGNALVTGAEQWVSSGMAAVVVGSMPLWAALLGGLFGRWPARREWLGLAVGMAGVLVLNLGGELRGSPLGAGLLLASTLSWSLGTVLGRELAQAPGLVGSAAQMLCGGAVLLALAALRGERLATLPATVPLLSFLYLTLFGSLVAYSAYRHLLARVRPALATSYAYVNPVVAVALGALLLGERFEPSALIALLLVLGGVALVALGRSSPR